MNYFTHDHLIKAVLVMHPELTHGVDFMAVMGVNPDGSPASDAWIEGWRAPGVPQPSVEELKAAVAGMDLNSLPMFPSERAAQQAARNPSPIEFLERFTADEQLAITTASMQSPQVRLWYDKMLGARFIDIADPRVIAGVDSLIAAGLIAPSRKAALLVPANQIPVSVL